MKKITKILGVAAIVAVAVFGFAACDDGGGKSHTHTWGEYSQTTAPTCTAAGIKTKVCTGCGETDPVTQEGDPIDPNAHNYGDHTVTTTRTLTLVEARVCSHDPTHTTETREIANSAQGVWIQGGTFTMGSPTTEANRETNETQHQVTLTGFYMGKYPVTQAQYEAVTGTNPSNFKTPVSPETSTANRPVETVSWYGALVFCNKLSVNEGLTPAYRISGSTDPAAWGTVPTSSNATWNAVEIVAGSTGYRLPTEAQWEYACRAETETAYNTGATISDNTGWYASNSGSRTHSVGEKPANAWGLYDMHGNVYEWCWDWYGDYASGTQTDPTGAVSGNYRVIRGGSWSASGQRLRSAYRYFDYPYSRGNTIGFRLVRP